MMRIYLDDFETSLQADCVANALRVASGVVEKSGRMIVEVAVDGVSWGDEDLASSEFTARDAGEIRLSTAHPAELFRDTLIHAADAVLNALELQSSAAKLMQGTRSREGLDALLEALSVWSTVQSALTRGLELSILSREELCARGIDLDGSIQALDAQLRALRDAMLAQDTTAISDCLLYEFPVTSKRFAAMLAALANELARVAQSSAVGPCA
jgi:hypothetical protein